jgi:hypothetical protein
MISRIVPSDARKMLPSNAVHPLDVAYEVHALRNHGGSRLVEIVDLERDYGSGLEEGMEVVARAVEFEGRSVRDDARGSKRLPFARAKDGEALWMRKVDPAVLVSPPATDRAEPGLARETKPLLATAPVVDTEAPPKRKREPAMSASPVNALFEPRAVLSSMKATFPSRVNCEPLAIVLICPFRNSIALSPVSPTLPLRVPAVPTPAPPVTSRSAWLAAEPSRRISPVLSSDAAVTSSDAESVALPMRREPLLVSVPPMLRIVPPAPPLRSTFRRPRLSRTVATVFVPADLTRRLDESVMELTVPIEAEATHHE